MLIVGSNLNLNFLWLILNIFSLSQIVSETIFDRSLTRFSHRWKNWNLFERSEVSVAEKRERRTLTFESPKASQSAALQQIWPALAAAAAESEQVGIHVSVLPALFSEFYCQTRTRWNKSFARMNCRDLGDRPGIELNWIESNRIESFGQCSAKMNYKTPVKDDSWFCYYRKFSLKNRRSAYIYRASGFEIFQMRKFNLILDWQIVKQNHRSNMLLAIEVHFGSN